MSRKRTEINSIRAERFKIIISREKITQTELQGMIHLSQQSISRIVQSKQALTEETAQAIINVFPDYRIEWLLGYDDTMLVSDEIMQVVRNKVDSAEAIRQVINLITAEICSREGMQRPDIPFFPDFTMLQEMLHDYAELLINDYIKNRANSRIWRRLEDKNNMTQEGRSNEKGKR